MLVVQDVKILNFEVLSFKELLKMALQEGDLGCIWVEERKVSSFVTVVKLEVLYYLQITNQVIFALVQLIQIKNSS